MPSMLQGECKYYVPERSFMQVTDYFFGSQMALSYRLDAISQGPKKSRFPGPNPLPLALVMDAARIKSSTHGAV